MIDAELLLWCWGDLNQDAASGVDQVSAAEYAKELHANVAALVEKLKKKRYRAKLVRWSYIPKENGKKRPLGILVIEDKLLQLACAKLLGAIYEQDFLDCSYAYRPKRGPGDAVKDLTFKLQYGSYGYLVELDIKSYFDRIVHDLLVEMLGLRIDDRAFLNLIRKWLKAGILDTDGMIIHPETGTPQGGIVTPRTQKVTSSSHESLAISAREKRLDKCHIRLYLYDLWRSLPNRSEPNGSTPLSS
jgi:group II intron reverse transcriptase/maturase